jgi:hypothetical protein
VVPKVWELLGDADLEIPDTLRPFFAEGCHEIRKIEENVKEVEAQLTALSKQLPAITYLLSVPGTRPPDRHRPRGLPDPIVVEVP